MSSYTETFNNREPPCVTRDAAWSRTHRDLQATAMSIDYSGQWVLLAGRFANFSMKSPLFKATDKYRKKVINEDAFHSILDDI